MTGLKITTAIPEFHRVQPQQTPTKQKVHKSPKLPPLGGSISPKKIGKSPGAQPKARSVEPKKNEDSVFEGPNNGNLFQDNFVLGNMVLRNLGPKKYGGPVPKEKTVDQSIEPTSPQKKMFFIKKRNPFRK